MARLGQLLVKANLVTENNLARALGVQHFAGGRLGTLLLERGSVTEDDLGSTLAQQNGCEYVSWRVLGDVSPSIISLLPAKFAIKHSAIPYERGEGYLKLALRDPSDLRILDELFFVTGRKVIPAVAPEVRLFQALEKYYGERRTPRFAILAEKLSRPARAVRTNAPEVPPPPSFFPEISRKPPVLPPQAEIWGDPAEPDMTSPPIIEEWKIPDQMGGWAGTAAPSFPQPPPDQTEPISWEELPPALWLQPGEDQARRATPPLPTFAPDLPVADASPAARARAIERERVSPSNAAVSEPARPGVRPRATGANGFPELAEARDRDSIARGVLAALSRRFARAAIFTAKPAGISGWGAAGHGVDAAAVRGIEIPWNEPSLFLNVRLSRSFYLGPLPPLPRHSAIVRAFGGSPRECVLHPVSLKEKTVAFLYAEFPNDRGATPADLAFLRELADAAAIAFATAIRLKKKEI